MATYTRAVTFGWDEKKASTNLEKHGVDFREAATVCGDALSTTFPDHDHATTSTRPSAETPIVMNRRSPSERTPRSAIQFGSSVPAGSAAQQAREADGARTCGRIPESGRRTLRAGR